jgi:phosphopantothenoylcysteine decarboxylase / phosphopantothenate---cysteine ligase
MKTIVIGITSSISCFKVVDLVRKLKKSFNIEVIMNANAAKLISVKEFEKVLGNKVHTELFVKGFTYKDYLKREKLEHISLADKADLFLICPSTANTIGKIANGIADDLLTTSVMATNAPVLVCPAMNCKMWENSIVQENVVKLKRKGYYFVDPEKGKLACGYSGVGRLANLGKVIGVVNGLIGCKDMLKGKRIIVTAGGTSEEIDPVRVITNKSSGKMGIYIAEEAAKMGAKVTLIRGRTDVLPFGKIKDIRLNSVKELFNSIKKNVKGNDIIIHAAAVSDFVVDKEKNKIKSLQKKPLILKLKNSIKIIDEIKKLNKKIKLVGFKAEHDVNKKKLIDSSYSLLKQSKADFVVGNDVSKNVFGSEDNDVVIVDKNKKVVNVKGSKREIGREILRLI